MYNNIIYKLSLYQKTKENITSELIGFITFYIDNNLNLKILFLNIYEQFQGKGFGKLIMIYLFNFIIRYYSNYFLIKSISLDDCSDLACTRQSIYYKLGFRILSSNNQEIMKVNFLKPFKSKSYHFSYDDKISPPIHFKSFIDFYNNLINENKLLLEKSDKSKSNFKIKIYIEKNNEYNEIDNKFEIKSLKKIIQEAHYLRDKSKIK